MITFQLLSFLPMFSLCTPQSVWNPVVETPSGKISGKTEMFNGKLVNAFLGIPYAKPPLGELRFKRPQTLEPWNNTLKAHKFPPGCPQYSTSPYPSYDDLPGKSEDCLYLNIWVPWASQLLNKLSVMFWIHGGGFFVGSSRIKYYNGRALAADGDVIVVTINYRVQAFGFLYSGTEDAPGNVGMWDMVEALKWVRTNILFFGGNKDSITLFGQSSGGIAIGMFCVSPETRRLFKRVIMQSGTPTILDGNDNDRNYRNSQKLAEAVGCSDSDITLEDNPSTVVNCLRGVEANELAKVFIEVAGMDTPVFPGYDDELFLRNPREDIINGNFEPVDVLIGSNNGDGAMYVTDNFQDIFGFFGEKDPQIDITLGESILTQIFTKISDDVIDQYLDDVDETAYERIRFQVFTARGDYSRTCPSIFFAERFARQNPNVYYYFFSGRPRNSPFAPWMLAVHFDETPYVFGYPLRYPENYTIAEQRLSQRMIRAWSSFAKTGTPQGGKWPRYSEQNHEYQVLDTALPKATGEGPHLDDCNFFRPYFGF